jgi:hypothetical protein
MCVETMTTFTKCDCKIIHGSPICVELAAKNPHAEYSDCPKLKMGKEEKEGFCGRDRKGICPVKKKAAKKHTAAKMAEKFFCCG